MSQSQDGQDGYTQPDKYDYEEFEEVNYDELNAIFSESGADRELDFDREQSVYLLCDHPERYARYNLKWYRTN